MSELIDQLRKRTEEIGADWSDHSMLLTVISVIERQQAEIEQLKASLSNLCDSIEDTDDHGGGAHDDDCPICTAIKTAQEALKHE